MGIDKKMLDIACEYLYEEENIFIIYINEDLIIKSSELKIKNNQILKIEKNELL